MACFHPLAAHRRGGPQGPVFLGAARMRKDDTPLALPCGKCLGCQAQKAYHWALRCHLEATQHESVIVSTLTYSDRYLPPTLDVRHLQLFHKRLRKYRKFRFFASGEYGERTQRPHYHAIYFGLSLGDMPLIERLWRKGHVHTERCTPAAIAYTAGYVSKKITYPRERHERVDPETGEVYQWQPPFRVMSRRPGIGAHAREFPQSWRSFAIQNGVKTSVPRYLHQAWLDIATPEQVQQLAQERLAHHENKTFEHYKASRAIFEAKHGLRASRRSL